MAWNYSQWNQLNLNIIIFSAEYDSPTFEAQSIQLYNILKGEFSLNCKYHFVPVFDHFQVIENILDERYILTQDEVLSTIRKLIIFIQ